MPIGSSRVGPEAGRARPLPVAVPSSGVPQRTDSFRNSKPGVPQRADSGRIGVSKPLPLNAAVIDFAADAQAVLKSSERLSFALLGFAASYYTFALPFQLFFNLDPKPQDFVTSYIVDAITFTCITMQLRERCKGERQARSRVPVRSVAQSASTTRTALVFQLIAAVPVDLAIWALPAAWWWLVPLLRLSRLVHAYRIRAVLNLLDHALVISYTKVKLIKLLLVSLGAANLFACLFYYVAARSTTHYATAPWSTPLVDAEEHAAAAAAGGVGNGGTESPDGGGGAGGDVSGGGMARSLAATDVSFLGDAYLRTLYWAFISLTTVGHVDVIRAHGVEPWEYLFAIGLCVLAMIFYTYVVANATTIMLRADRTIEAYRASLEKVERYLSHRGVSPALRKLVRTHFRNLSAGQEEDDADKILSQMPRALRTDVLRDLNYKLIAPSYLFGACAESLVGALCTILQNEIFVPGQIICREGDMMRQMWFLMDGFVFQPDEKIASTVERARAVVTSLNGSGSSARRVSMQLGERLDAANRTSFGGGGGGGGALRRSSTSSLRLAISKVMRSGSVSGNSIVQYFDTPGTALAETAFLFSQRQDAMLVSKAKTSCVAVHRDAFNSLMADNEAALTKMRDNVISRLRERDRESADKLVVKSKRRRQMLITELLYAAANGDAGAVHDVLHDSTSGVKLHVDDADYDGRRALHVAASDGQLHVVRALLELRADVNVKDRFGNTPLRDAVRAVDEEVVALLRAHGGDIGRDGVAAAMCEAAVQGDVRQLQLMLHTGVAIDSCDYDKRTALHVAASEGNRATVSFLLEQGASVNALDRWSGTPLHDAVREGRVEVAQMLCEAGGLLRYDKEKESGTLCEFARAGNLEAIGRLLTSGCGVNADDYDKRTCLHLAASEGNIRIAELLLEHGADIDSRDRWGGTPLRDAVREGHWKLAAMLTARGASLGMDEEQSSSTLCELARQGKCEQIKCLLESKCEVNAKDYDARTALHLAASEGNKPVVELLLASGADVAAKDRWGSTPLIDAQREGHAAVAKLLGGA